MQIMRDSKGLRRALETEVDVHQGRKHEVNNGYVHSVPCLRKNNR